MAQKLRIGYFKHWFQPPYSFVSFLEEQGIEIEKIENSLKGYLEKYDVAIVEQHGFNDFVENDELYIRDWVSRGGILLFMHQDYMRWAPYFLPHELGHTHLIHRYIPTIGGCKADESFTYDNTPYMAYLMPWIEEPGRRLFSEPETITPDEMLDWHLDTNTFRIVRGNNVKLDGQLKNEGQGLGEHVRTTAQSCFLANENWEVIGSFMDPAVKDGALILKGAYGKGMYFLNQILFPETNDARSERVFAFWKKYIRNLLAYFERFKNGESEQLPPREKKTLPIKKNYKLAAHMHSLDWYGCDAQPGTIHALLRYKNVDICSIAIKDNAPYDGQLDVDKYSDDKVLFLDGQEYHPFNWGDKNSHLSHNTYHALAIGIDPDAYTQEFTQSRYSDAEIAENIQKAIDHVHEHNGVICATHPNVDYWKDYDYDAVDVEPMRPLSGRDIETAWLNGKKFALMVSVDLFGTRRYYDNPAVNFIYLKGAVPCRDSVCEAIREGRTLAACGFEEADVCIGDVLPGETLTMEEAKAGKLHISAKVIRETIRKVRVYSDKELIFEKNEDMGGEISMELPLADYKLGQYIRVELEGFNDRWICNSTPIYIEGKEE